MRISLLALALLVLSQDPIHGASRTWTSRKGVQVKAEFTGVLNGRVVLNQGGRRSYVRLSEFVLEDRDFLVDLMLKRKQDRQLAELMLAENQVPVILPNAANPNPNGDVVPDDAFNGGNPNAGAVGQPSAQDTDIYGLPIPSPELLADDAVHSWTDLTGRKVLATFERVVAPGHFTLKQANGRSGHIAIVNFSKEDIHYVKEVLAKDWARPVFPPDSAFQALTADAINQGCREWTDRKDVKLVGKFVGTSGRNVILEVNYTKTEYPLAGLSPADRQWIDTEQKRLADEARQRQEAARAAAQANTNGGSSGSPYSRPSGIGGGHGENGSSGGRSSLFPQYKCDTCGWNGSSPFCPNCSGTYKFTCNRCGHSWTKKHQAIDTCPNCNAGGGNRMANSPSGSGAHGGTYSGASSSSPEPTTPDVAPGSYDYGTGARTNASDANAKEGQNVLMTIVYVGLGIAVLGGIATGLFRAFG